MFLLSNTCLTNKTTGVLHHHAVMLPSLLALSGRALDAVGHHLFTADNLAKASYHSQAEPVPASFLTLWERKGSVKTALSAFAMEQISIPLFYKKYEILGRSKQVLSATVNVIQDFEATCDRYLQQAPAVIIDDPVAAPGGRFIIRLGFEQEPEKAAQFYFRALAKGAKKTIIPMMEVTFVGAAVILTGFRLSGLVTLEKRDKGKSGAQKITG